MSKTYHVIITVVAPEGWEFDPYDLNASTDEVFGESGAEIVNIAQTEDKEKKKKWQLVSSDWKDIDEFFTFISPGSA